ncbi:MAG: mannosyltransferase [Miltoncostaeaceae bacterium]|nr:mannosyltransferase [Miltoncostaeaceae bacterium]
MILIGGLSFLFFARLLTGDTRRRTLVAWTVVSALALATHYFSVFLVGAEGIWLLATTGNRRPVAAALGALAAVQAALAPLLLHQRSLDLADFIDDVPLGYRVARTPKQLLVGFDAPGEVASAVVAGLLVAFAAWLVWTRGDDRERRAARIGLVVGAVVLVIPALAGPDYFDTRNVVVGWLPLAVAVAAGLGARGAGRAGLAAAAALTLVCGSTVVFVATNRTLQRDDWRGVAEALEPADATPRAVVVSPSTAAVPLGYYAPQLEAMPGAGTAVREIDLVSMPLRRITQSRPGPPPRPADQPPPAPGFELVEKRFGTTFTLLRYTAPAPVPVNPAGLVAMHVDTSRPAAVFVER